MYIPIPWKRNTVFIYENMNSKSLNLSHLNLNIVGTINQLYNQNFYMLMNIQQIANEYPTDNVI